MASLPEGVRHGDPYRRMLGLFIPFEVSMALAMAGVWVLIGALDVRVAAATLALRSVLWCMHLRSVLAPVRSFWRESQHSNDELAFGRDDDPMSDALVLEADSALARLGVDAARSYALLWFAVELIWLALAGLDLPFDVANGRAELFAGSLFACASLGLVSLMHMLLESVLPDMRERVAQALASRRLQPVRPAVSLTRPIVAAAGWMLVGGTLACGGGALVWSAEVSREHTTELLLLRARLSAERSVAGAATEPDDAFGVEIVDADALPPVVAQALAEREHPEQGVAFHVPEQNLAYAAVPLGDGRHALGVAEPDEHLGVLGGVLLIIIFIAVPGFILGFWLFTRAIARPLERVSSIARTFVEHGELHELERVIPLRNDELGRLTHSFNDMLDLLEQLAATAAAVSAGDLTVRLTQPGELHDAFRGMLVRLNEIVGRLRETSLELASAAAEIGALTQQQEEAMLNQATNIQQVASTVSSLTTSAEQIAEASLAVLQDAEQSVATTDETAARIAALRQHTASIGELLHVIGEVADRSDLLALNGALEATRAGEAGRGFALVASEMRRLAERVTGTVEDVRTKVVEIESSGASTVQATERSRELAQRTAAAAGGITQVTAAQSRDTEQAAQGMQSVADMVIAATGAMSQTRAAAEGLRDHAKELERLIATFELRASEREPPSSR